MFALLWQMEMEGSRPEGSACRDRAEKGAQILYYQPHLLGEAKLEINRALALPWGQRPKRPCLCKAPSPFHLGFEGEGAAPGHQSCSRLQC